MLYITEHRETYLTPYISALDANAQVPFSSAGVGVDEAERGTLLRGGAPLVKGNSPSVG